MFSKQDRFEVVSGLCVDGLAKALPEWTFRIEDEFVVGNGPEIEGEKPGALQVRVPSFAPGKDLGKEVDGWVAALVEIVTGAENKKTEAEIKEIIVPVLKQTVHAMGVAPNRATGGEDVKRLYKPIVESAGLVSVCPALNMPQTFSFLGDAPGLANNIGLDGLIEIGLQNLRAMKWEVAAEDDSHLVYVCVDEPQLSASLILLPEVLEDAHRRLGSDQLLVCIPSQYAMIAIKSLSEQWLLSMVFATEEIFTNTDTPLCPFPLISENGQISGLGMMVEIPNESRVEIIQ